MSEHFCRGRTILFIGDNMKKTLFILATFVLLFSTGCSKAQKTWITDIESAEVMAADNGKDIMLVFTGSDWNEESKTLAENVFTDKFFASGSKNFILCNIDILRDETQLDQEVLEKNYQAANRFAVQQIPSVFLITAEKDIYGVFSPEADITSPSELFTRVESFEEKRTLLVDLKEKIQTTDGIEKARHMDQFLDALYPIQRDTYRNYIEEIARLDEDGTAGLGAKYLLQLEYLRAMEFYREDNMEAAGEGFFTLARSGKLDAAKKQEALYMGTYMYAMAETVPSTKLVEWLEEAVAADPENPGVTQILTMIEKLNETDTGQ